MGRYMSKTCTGETKMNAPCPSDNYRPPLEVEPTDDIDELCDLIAENNGLGYSVSGDVIGYSRKNQ